jgi:ribosomal protein S18 acetylase RimI-like enzyme
MEHYESVYALWISTPGMGLNNLDDSREGIGKYLDRNPRTCFVALEQGRVIGVILSGHDGRRGFIYHTAVAVGERGKGVGTALVDRAVEALRAEGINKVALVVYENNATGNGFWEALGFDRRTDLAYRNKVIAERPMKVMDPKA